jgi:hypothetical protein
MANLEVHAGDFLTGPADTSFGVFGLRTRERSFLGERILYSELAEVSVATEESVKRIGGTVGWGVAGAVILGPVGLLAGLLLGGRKKDVTFVAKFKDGRRILATTDSKTFIKIQAAVF